MSSLVTPESYVDNCSTTVASGGYTAASGVLNVASTGSPFPQTQQFHFYIADATTKAVKAIGKATAINSGTQWAVTMSLDVNANQNDLVVLSLCADAMDQIRADVNQIGTRANLPSTTGQKAGNSYTCSDSPYDYLYDGSAWQARFGCFPVTEPVSGNFSWANQGGASVSSTQGGEALTAPNSASADALRVRYIAGPSTPYTITAAFLLTMANNATGFPQVGLCFYNSTSGKLVTIGLTGWNSNGAGSILQKWNSVSSFNGNYIGLTSMPWAANQLCWLRVNDTGTNFVFSISMDGVNWIVVETVSRTDFLTPDKVGYFANANSVTLGLTGWLVHWKQT